jgi:hypothetical protein
MLRAVLCARHVCSLVVRRLVVRRLADSDCKRPDSIFTHMKGCCIPEIASLVDKHSGRFSFAVLRSGRIHRRPSAVASAAFLLTSVLSNPIRCRQTQVFGAGKTCGGRGGLSTIAGRTNVCTYRRATLGSDELGTTKSSMLNAVEMKPRARSCTCRPARSCQVRQPILRLPASAGDSGRW